MLLCYMHHKEDLCLERRLVHAFRHGAQMAINLVVERPTLLKGDEPLLRNLQER